MKILYDLLQFLASGFGNIFLCVLGNNNKNVIETLKHLKNLIKSTLKTTPVTNSGKYPVNFIDFNYIFILISLGYFKSSKRPKERFLTYLSYWSSSSVLLHKQ